MTKHYDIVERNEFPFIAAIFSYTWQMNEKVDDFVTQRIKLKMHLQNPDVSGNEIKKIARSWIKQLSAVLNEAASRNILERTIKLVDTASSWQIVGKALDEIEVDGIINEPVITSYRSLVSQEDLEEVEILM
jgi:hypothetical protein